MNRTHRRPGLTVTTGGRGVVAHAGARLLCDLADDLGLSHGLSAAMAPTKRRRRGHDRGRVLVDLAVALADGATAISDLRVLANQPALFGAVASVPTAWRTLESIDGAALERIAAARAQARARAWAAGMDPGFSVIDIDGTLVNAHSDKEQCRAPSFGGFRPRPGAAPAPMGGPQLVRRTPKSYPRPLTARECATLERKARGMTQKEIAFEFGVSINTVGNLAANAYKKLDVHGAAAAVHAHRAAHFYCGTHVDFGPIRERLKGSRSASVHPNGGQAAAR